MCSNMHLMLGKFSSYEALRPICIHGWFKPLQVGSAMMTTNNSSRLDLVLSSSRVLREKDILEACDKERVLEIAAPFKNITELSIVVGYTPADRLPRMLYREFLRTFVTGASNLRSLNLEIRDGLWNYDGKDEVGDPSGEAEPPSDTTLTGSTIKSVQPLWTQRLKDVKISTIKEDADALMQSLLDLSQGPVPSVERLHINRIGSNSTRRVWSDLIHEQTVFPNASHLSLDLDVIIHGKFSELNIIDPLKVTDLTLRFYSSPAESNIKNSDVSAQCSRS